jgi:hypothetical protein
VRLGASHGAHSRQSAEKASTRVILYPRGTGFSVVGIPMALDA